MKIMSATPVNYNNRQSKNNSKQNVSFGQTTTEAATYIYRGFIKNKLELPRLSITRLRNIDEHPLKIDVVPMKLENGKTVDALGIMSPVPGSKNFHPITNSSQESNPIETIMRTLNSLLHFDDNVTSENADKFFSAKRAN